MAGKQVTVTATPEVVLSLKQRAKGSCIFNSGEADVNIYLEDVGDTPATLDTFTLWIIPGALYELPMEYTGDVLVAAPGGGLVQVTQYG